MLRLCSYTTVFLAVLLVGGVSSSDAEQQGVTPSGLVIRLPAALLQPYQSTSEPSNAYREAEVKMLRSINQVLAGIKAYLPGAKEGELEIITEALRHLSLITSDPRDARMVLDMVAKALAESDQESEIAGVPVVQVIDKAIHNIESRIRTVQRGQEIKSKYKLPRFGN